MSPAVEAQVVAALEDNAKAHAEIDRLRLVVAALEETLSAIETIRTQGLAVTRLASWHAALALARAEVKPVESYRSCDALLVDGRCPAHAEVKP